MKKKFLAALLFGTVICHGQKTIDVDKNDGITYSLFFTVGGEPYVGAKFTRLVSGTPYFKDQWMKGSDVRTETTNYRGGILKLDLLEEQVHFLDASGQEMIATAPIRELTLTDTVAGGSYHFVHSGFFQDAAPKKGWYLQKANGKAGLYVFFSKQLTENKPYGSATAEQTIYTRNEFYLYHQGSFLPIKKAKDIPSILADKRKELEEFYKKSEIQKVSDEDRMTAIVNYYNTLQ